MISNNKIVLLLFSLFLIITTSIAQSSTYFTYTITEEDKSLWAICQRHNVQVETVKSLNKMSSNGIRVGEQLKIPKQTQITEGDGYLVHEVSKEDKSLWRICQNFAVSISEVQALNEMESSAIKIGQQLKIPTGHLVVHIFAKEDKSIWRICQNYGVNLADLKEFNNKKNNVVRLGDRILIPKEWITNEPKEQPAFPDNSPSKWQEMGKPVFDVLANQLDFPFTEKKEFKINPTLLQQLSVKQRLDYEDYVRLYQQASQKSSIFYNSANYKDFKKLYYYSIEEPFLIDLVSLEYYPLSDKKNKGIEHGYSYDFLTVLEVDSATNMIQILPVFLYKNHFGEVRDYFGKPLNGAFSCCANAHPLAYYKKDKKAETIGYSVLLSPSVMKYTEVVTRFQGPNIVQVDSTILILQLETFDIPTLIDIEEFKNGKKMQGFVQVRRRRELGY